MIKAPQYFFKLFLAGLTAVLLIGTAYSSMAASSIGVSFVGRGGPGPNGQSVLNPSDSAGVAPQTHWNNLFENDNTFSGISGNLSDNTGTFTSVVLIYNASDAWNSDGPSVTGNDLLMKGIIKANPSPDCAPTNNTDTITLTISNLMAGATYNVIVYQCENGTGAAATVSIPSTGISYFIAQTNSFDGTFLRSTDTLGAYPNANYVEFDGVAPDANKNIVVTAVKRIDCDFGVTPPVQINDGIGIPGIQIVQVSGPAFPPNTLSCSITNSPSSTNVIIGFPVTFIVGATGPHNTQWQTNGVPIPGAINDSYTIASAAASDNGVVYTAVVYNNVNTNTSSPATLSTHINDVPVVITSNPSDTLAVEGGTASFSVGATGNFIQYQWQKNGANILNATNANYTTPPTVFPGDNGATFRVIVFNNVNTNTSSSATLTVDQNVPPRLTQGFLKVDQWQNLDGTAVSTLITAINGGPPNASFFAAGANVPQTNPNIDSFGDRATGWFSPDVTGDYYFFIRSDDSSQLFLNSTAAASGTNTLPNINTDTPICLENSCCNAFMETNSTTPPTQTTATPIHLEAGKLYGAVILLKEGGGNDYVQVAWRLAQDTTKAASLKPIPPGNCWTLATPAGQRASFTTQPKSTTVVQDRSAKFSVALQTSPVANLFGIQWFSNNVAIPGAAGSTYTTPGTLLSDNGNKYYALAYTLAGPQTSSVATLTVIADTFPPAPGVGTITRNDGLIQLGVGFDEPVNPAGLIAANFSVPDATTTTFHIATNSYNTYNGIVIDTTGLVPGSSHVMHIQNISDVHGNTLASTNVSFTVGPVRWADTGVPVRPGQVVPVGDTGFDVLSGGRKEWDNYDEITMAYVNKTNDFDVECQVILAEPGSQWTRVGLIARNNLDAGNASTDGVGHGTHSAYAQTHVNPTQDLKDTGLWPAADPVQPQNGASNNGHEQNTRLAGGGGNMSSWGNIPGDPGYTPDYPNNWLRLTRVGAVIQGRRSSDGINWIDQGTVTLTDQQANMVVGVELGVETCNIWCGNSGGFDIWGPTDPACTAGCTFDPTYDRLFIAQFRNFVDIPSLSLSRPGGVPTLTFVGALQSGSSVSGPYADVPGATSPYTIPIAPGNVFYRVRGTITPH